MGLAAVVEDDVVPGGVVAHVSHAGFCALGLTIQGERRRQRTGLLDRAVVNHVDRHGQLGDQVAGSGTVGERGLEPAGPITIWIFIRSSRLLSELGVELLVPISAKPDRSALGEVSGLPVEGAAVRAPAVESLGLTATGTEHPRRQRSTGSSRSPTMSTPPPPTLDD